MIGKARAHRGRQWRRISCFLLFLMVDVLIISFLLSLVGRALPTTGLSAQQSKAKQSKALSVLVLLSDASSFFSWASSLRLSSDKARNKNKTAKLFPCCTPPHPGGLAATCIGFLSDHLLHSFLAPRCRYWSLILEPPAFARKKAGSKTLISNPLYISPGTLFVLFVLFILSLYLSNC